MKRKSITRDIVVFYATDLPNAATHCDQSLCGFSLYRGVLVQWDEDEDTRVLGFIDDLPDQVRQQLLVVQEHEGSLLLLWRDSVPEGYSERDGVYVEGDWWCINTSKAPVEESVE